MHLSQKLQLEDELGHQQDFPKQPANYGKKTYKRMTFKAL